MYRRWDGSAGAWVLDEAVETLERQQLELPPLSSHPDDLNAWAAANPPPCRDDFATQELFDAAREPWYVLLMGTRLPPYGQNAKRAKAWGRACMRHSERSASHRSRRSVPRSWQKSLLPLRHGRTLSVTVCARVSLQRALATWDAPRHQRRREGAEKGQLGVCCLLFVARPSAAPAGCVSSVR